MTIKTFDSVEAEMLHHMALAFFASAFADYQEKKHENEESFNHSGLPLQRSHSDIPDEIDPAALDAAETLMRDFLLENPMIESAEAWLHYVQYSFRHGGTSARTAEMIGHYMAMQAMRNGVGLCDAFGRDAEDFEVPRVEFDAYSLEKDY